VKLNSFYEATTALCFALLGFWWVVIQMRHDEFTSDRRMRAIAYNVSLSFVLPGLMSLTALLAVENNALWRVGFGVAGLAGAMQSAYVIATPATYGVRRGILRAGRWATLVLYALIALVALRPRLANDVGMDVSGLAVEGAIVALFLFLNVNLAFAYFMHPSHEPLLADAASDG
jgi:hypothetical protein